MAKKFHSYTYGFRSTDDAINEALTREVGGKIYRHNIEIKSNLDDDVIQVVLYKSTNTPIASFASLYTAMGSFVYTCGGYHLNASTAIPINGLSCDNDNTQLRYYYPSLNNSTVVLMYGVINHADIKSITDTVTEV